ncbi:MAG: hypothetical protein ABI784_03905 [Ginsengibacter sp.]
MNTAKIHLSPQEIELLINPEWLLIKNQVIQKVMNVYGGIHQLFRQRIIENKAVLPLHISASGGKISKGNNFKGLPFVVLDYPANFGKKDVFCVRCFFLWGNYFIISLHLSGKYLSIDADFRKWLEYYEEKNFSINISSDEWNQEWDGYEEIDLNKNQLQEKYFKVAAKINVADWEMVPEFFQKKFNEIVSFLCTNYHPTGGTIL